MGRKRNKGRGAIANAKVNKLPRKQPSQNSVSKSNKDSCHIGGLAQLSRKARKDN
jgi:hypothetical protein